MRKAVIVNDHTGRLGIDSYLAIYSERTNDTHWYRDVTNDDLAIGAKHLVIVVAGIRN